MNAEKRNTPDCKCSSDDSVSEIENRFQIDCNIEGFSRPGRLNVVTGNRNAPTNDSKSPRRGSLQLDMQLMQQSISIEQQNAAGTLKLADGREYKLIARDLLDQGEISKGSCATVNKMVHVPSGKSFAVKRIRSTVDETCQKNLLAELDEVVSHTPASPFIIATFGALFWEGDCWICMEVMEISLEKFYKFTDRVLRNRLPDSLISNVAYATVNALNYLKEQLNLTHRDVKPSNILLDRRGSIKLGDFGIGRQLVDIMAKTRDAGCRPYMPPERIDPSQASEVYEPRSDVWSLGITLVEVASGKFPYPKWNSVFEQLDSILHGEVPTLPADDGHGGSYSGNIISFVCLCLVKDLAQRATYDQLLKHPLMEEALSTLNEVPSYVSDVLSRITDRSQLDFDAADSG